MKSSKDRWDRYWDKKQDTSSTYSNEGRIIESLAPLTELVGSRILEVGAGTGRDSVDLAREGAEVHVLDYSRPSLSIIRRMARSRQVTLHCVEADGLIAPFRGETFDIVFHQGLLEHFRDPRPLLRENLRILKPGGLLLVDVPQKWHVYTIFKKILMTGGFWFAGWETQYSPGGLKRLLETEGLQIVRLYGSWMEPGLVYRVLKEAGLRLGIRLTLYPRGLFLFSDIKKLLRRLAGVFGIGPNFGFTIGAVARKGLPGKSR